MWTKEEEGKYIISCLPHIDKMLQQVKTKDIIVSPGRMNVSFIKDQKVYSMSWHNLYRFSGRAVLYRQGKDENEMIPIELTYPMYLDLIIKPWIFKILLE